MAKKASGSSADTIIKLVLIFFISLLSFSVGTFVGKQVSDADYRKAAIEGDYDHFHADAKTKDAGDDKGLTEDDIASLTEEFVNSEKRDIASADATKKPAAAAAGASGADIATAETQGYKQYSKAVPSKNMQAKAAAQKELMAEKAPATVEKAAARVAAGKAPIADKPEERKPTSVLPSVATSAVGKFTVQVASYADEAEAKAHSAKLKTKGWNAFYIPAEIKGRTWYRVSVGLFSTTASAEKFKSELVKEANISSAYVQKIVQ
jgi:cell division septation protein DedD